MDIASILFVLPMSFPQRLAALRKDWGFKQQQMADKIGMHVSQLKRCEAGASQPMIEVFGRIALALNVSADMLLFAEDERGPDERLKLLFEARSRLDDHERAAVQTMCAGVLPIHDAKRWQLLANAPSAARAPAQPSPPSPPPQSSLPATKTSKRALASSPKQGVHAARKLSSARMVSAAR